MHLQYNGGNIPEGSRFAVHKDFFSDTIGSFSKEEGKKKFAKIDQLMGLAEKGLLSYSLRSAFLRPADLSCCPLKIQNLVAK